MDAYNEDTRTMRELALGAIHVQSACNLSGVAISFASVVQRVRRLLENERRGSVNTSEVNEHAVCKLWASKLHELTRMGLSDCDAYAHAYAECKRLAGEEV